MVPEPAVHVLQQELLDVRRTLGWVDLVMGRISEAVCVIDHEHNIVFVNSTFEELAHGQRIFLLGEPITNILDLESAEGPFRERLKSVQDDLSQAESIGGIYTQRYLGSTQVFELTIRYISTLNQAVCMLHNITLQAETDRMKSEFIALASHQLRTPLSTIKVYSHMLLQGYAGHLAKPQEDYLTTMIHAADHMYYIVNNLLNISRLETGQFTISQSSVDLVANIQEVLDMVQPKATEKSIHPSFHHPHDRITIRSDNMMLREIFSNIIMNAIQYTPPEGKVNIVVSHKGHEAVVKISDTGIGIPPEAQDKLFSPFYRATNALEHFPGGTGLGLYVVKLMLESLNGQISFTSHEGQGTSFMISLPLQTDDDVASDKTP